jgi:hypothetical protein
VARDGCLIGYGPNFAALWRRPADYVARILRGAKPGQLPIEQPTLFEFAVNLKTAKALGLTIPEVSLLRAEEVIELHSIHACSGSMSPNGTKLRLLRRDVRKRVIFDRGSRLCRSGPLPLRPES